MSANGRGDLQAQAIAFVKARWADFRKFSPGQKAVTVVAVLALAIGGFLLATWKSDPAYAPLYSNLAASDASSIVSKLGSEGVPYKLADGGATVSVPVDKVDAARLSLSAAGLPNSGQTGYALLDKEGVTTSQFKQQVDYQRAVEGELAKTIQSIDGVESASVHLAIPADDVFSDDSAKPTGAVLLSVAPGTTLTAEQVKSVVYLVSSSVPSMKASDVTVTDSNGDVLSAPGANGGSATQDQATATYNEKLRTEIQSLLDTTLGAGHSRVVVNAVMDYSRSKVNLTQYIGNKNAPVSSTKSEEKFTGSGSGASGTLGTTDTASGAGKNGTYDRTSETVNNSPDVKVTTTETPPGTIKDQNVAVVVDRSTRNLDLSALRNAISSAIGYDAQRGDQLSVDAVTFDNSAQQAAAAASKKAAAAEAAAASHAHLVGLIKQGAFAVLLIALVVGTWLAARKRRRPVRQMAEPEPEPEPLPEAPKPEPEPVRIVADPMQDTVNQRRKNLLVAADHRPAEVAHLLSGWLSTSGTASKEFPS